VRIHAIHFDSPLSALSVSPIIYAEDLSSNGTFLTTDDLPERRLPRKGGPVLINDGDRLRLGHSITCQFQFCVKDLNQPSLTTSQKLEIKVRPGTFVVIHN
jgi:hypothetical protein